MSNFNYVADSSELKCLRLMIQQVNTLSFCGYVKNEAKYTLFTDFI